MIKKYKKQLILIAALVVVLTSWSYFFKLSLNITPRKLSNNTPTMSAEPTFQSLSEVVIPTEGYTVPINWGDTGKKLVAAGGIDMSKYKKNYAGGQYDELLSYLTDTKNKGITINQDNAYFWVNTLWALGLTQKSDVLEKGVMGTQYGDQIGNFASTGGWTLGSKDAVKLFSSSEIIPLTADQQALVTKVSGGVYRPCCGNSVAFPDCNHGMAILGLLELMASQGATEEEMYKASLAFNSYWFNQTYIDLAYYFQTKEGLTWDEVDPKRALSAEFSSGQGYQAIKKQIGTIPGSENVGASCGA